MAVVLVALIYLEASKPRLALPVAFRLRLRHALAGSAKTIASQPGVGYPTLCPCRDVQNGNHLGKTQPDEKEK